jgi:hypothetical protein
MEESRVDRVARLVAARTSGRRALLTAVAGLAGVAVGADPAAAWFGGSCRRRQQSCRRRAQCCQRHESDCDFSDHFSGRVCCGPRGAFCLEDEGCCEGLICRNERCRPD